MKEIAIVHFQPLERYPPVMNIINTLANYKDKSKTEVYTTLNPDGNWFKKEGIKINRITQNNKSSIKRYWCYFVFNLLTTIKLFIQKPSIILGIETLSFFPIYIYKVFNKNAYIVLHHHEYYPLDFISKSSAYYKFLHKVEKKLYKLVDCVSLTNDDRLGFFLDDYKFIDKNKLIISENFPPYDWVDIAKQNKKPVPDDIIRIVHVGSLGGQTMYVKEIVDWVIAQNGKYQLDFYTENIETDVKEYLIKLNFNYIRLMGSIKYFELPKMLVNYDIGLTIYKKCFVNTTYLVPNKVLEYLACGLYVWYSSDLISTSKFVKKNKLNGCVEIDFRNNNIVVPEVFKKSFNLNENYYNLFKSLNVLEQKIINQII
jgi:hypothetical protein